MFESLECRRLFSGTVIGAAAAAVVVVDDGARDAIDLNASWHFRKGDPGNAEQINFDDAGWSSVNLPHTWNAQDGQDGGHDYYRGVGWYRRSFVAPAAIPGQQAFLKFEGASTVADVYVNGHNVGQHKGAFATFQFDVTPWLLPGAQNVFAVRVNNADDRSVAPIEGEGVTLGGPDFTIYGGLYRGVSLLITPGVHVSTSDFGSSGVRIDQSNVSAASAEIRIRARVENDAGVDRAVNVTTRILDAAGNVVAERMSGRAVGPGSTEDFTTDNTIFSPHLWNGVKDPYLYSVVVTVRDEASGQTDVVVQPLGIRHFRLDARNGFFLNGQYYDLRGVNYHQDMLDKGWARSRADVDRDVALMREMGVNFVRTSHYQQDQYAYDAFDKAGIIVWSEIPYIYDETDTEAFRDNLKQQLREEIRQNHNHPSAIFLGLFNGLNNDSGANALVPQLQTLARQEAPDRITIAAGVTRAGLDSDVNQHTDSIAYNNYFGWYRGSFDDLGPYVDDYHRRFPNRPVAIAEYGAGANPEHHEENPTEVVASEGQFHPEEYQAIFHESQWKQMKARPWLFAKAIFAMFEFASDGRDEGGEPGRNDKGLITYDRQIKKDAFYFYKANWTDTPFAYITSRRFTDAPGGRVDVKVYSTLGSVTLQVNGKVIGNRGGDPVNTFRWGDVALKAGANEITVVGSRDGRVYTDTVIWNRPGSGGVETRPANGLSVVYFDNPNLTGPAFTRVDPTVNFLWGNGSPNASVLGEDGFSAIWEGFIEPRFTEQYTLYTKSNNGVRLYIDGERVIDRWYAGGTLEYSAKLNLVAGQRHAVRMEYFDLVADASAQLFWRSASQAREIVPTSQLFVDPL